MNPFAWMLGFTALMFLINDEPGIGVVLLIIMIINIGLDPA